MTRSEPHSPGAIFLQLIGKIDSSLKKAKRARAFKKPKTELALRRQLFKLEGWAKLHRTWPIKKERKIFELIREQAKEMEDALGAIDVCWEMAASLREKRQEDLALLFDARAEKAHAKLKTLLKTRKWLNGKEASRAEKLRMRLLKIEWPSMTTQTDFMLQSLFKELISFGVRYREDLRSKLMRDVYDLKIIENDLHKLRRQLRWFSMYFQTADGLIGLGPVSDRLTVEKKNLVKDYAENPYAILPRKSYVRARIDTVAFYELTKLVDVLGEVKDRGEGYYFVKDALIENGATKEEAVERAESLYGNVPVELPAATWPILAEFERLKPHAYLAESLFE